MFENYQNLIEARLKKGEVIIVLGAGANYGSLNRNNKKIKFGEELAEELCKSIGESYSSEPLSEVASAAYHSIGKEAVNKILINEFRYCKPSVHLEKLFSYTWNRIYSWNYDDALIAASRKSAQRVSDYNGLNDSVEEISGSANLQIIYLHGRIDKIDKGLILSKEEYFEWLQSGKHDWYKELTSDYRSKLVIFIGTSLDEPILEAEIQRASRLDGGLGGHAFVITPDMPSGIRRAALSAKNIIHCLGTLEDFVNFLTKTLGSKFGPKDVIADQEIFTASNIDLFSHSDLEAAQYLRPIFPQEIRLALSQKSESTKQLIGRQFLSGFPPSWEISASDIPVKLTQSKELLDNIRNAIFSSNSLFVTIGQAGSGKSTATQQALLEIAEENLALVYELDPTVKSVSACLSVLKIINGDPKIIFLRNLSIFGGPLSDIFPEARSANVTFVSTARTGEWNEHFRRHFSNDAATFFFQRFSRDDFSPIIDRLKKYVPAPSFVKLSHQQQLAKLSKSKSQLLIALREATDSRNFDEIIRDEFESIENDDIQDFFIICGICTLARVGIDKSRAAEAYQNKKRNVGTTECLSRLQGIIEPASDGRLHARHEFYVRNIFENPNLIDRIMESIKDILNTFTKYEIPITKHVSRTDGALFRFLLNNGYLREISQKSGDRNKGLQVYNEFEIDFQLDGHFWLQYGLYYQRLNNGSKALEMFEKSVQAFPGNDFAIHALASERLHQVENEKIISSTSRKMIQLAVTELEKLECSPKLYIDTYPIVTLSRHHIGALVKHGLNSEAKSYAKEYFERLKTLDRISSSPEIREEMARLLTLLTSGKWTPASY